MPSLLIFCWMGGRYYLSLEAKREDISFLTESMLLQQKYQKYTKSLRQSNI